MELSTSSVWLDEHGEDVDGIDGGGDGSGSIASPDVFMVARAGSGADRLPRQATEQSASPSWTGDMDGTADGSEAALDMTLELHLPLRPALAPSPSPAVSSGDGRSSTMSALLSSAYAQLVPGVASGVGDGLAPRAGSGFTVGQLLGRGGSNAGVGGGALWRHEAAGDGGGVVPASMSGGMALPDPVDLAEFEALERDVGVVTQAAPLPLPGDGAPLSPFPQSADAVAAFRSLLQARAASVLGAAAPTASQAAVPAPLPSSPPPAVGEGALLMVPREYGSQLAAGSEGEGDDSEGENSDGAALGGHAERSDVIGGRQAPSLIVVSARDEPGDSAGAPAAYSLGHDAGGSAASLADAWRASGRSISPRAPPTHRTASEAAHRPTSASLSALSAASLQGARGVAGATSAPGNPARAPTSHAPATTNPAAASTSLRATAGARLPQRHVPADGGAPVPSFMAARRAQREGAGWQAAAGTGGGSSFPTVTVLAKEPPPHLRSDDAAGRVSAPAEPEVGATVAGAAASPHSHTDRSGAVESRAPPSRIPQPTHAGAARPPAAPHPPPRRSITPAREIGGPAASSPAPASPAVGAMRAAAAASPATRVAAAAASSTIGTPVRAASSGASPARSPPSVVAAAVLSDAAARASTEHERALVALVQGKVEALDAEVRRHQTEIAKVEAAQQELLAARRAVDAEARALASERGEFRAWKEAEEAKLDAWKEEQLAKMERERRVAVRQARAAATVATAPTDRRERVEMEALREEVSRLRAEVAAGEARYKAAIDRHKAVAAGKDARIAELEAALQHLEQQRVQQGGFAADAGAGRKGGAARLPSSHAAAASAASDSASNGRARSAGRAVSGAAAATRAAPSRATAKPAPALYEPAAYASSSGRASESGDGAAGDSADGGEVDEVTAGHESERSDGDGDGDGGSGDTMALLHHLTVLAGADARTGGGSSAATTSYDPGPYTAAAAAAATDERGAASSVPPSTMTAPALVASPLLMHHLRHRFTPAALAAGVRDASLAAGAGPHPYLLSATQLEPGKLQQAFSDGSRVVRFKNGTEKESRPDGTVIIRFNNGDVKREVPRDAGAAHGGGLPSVVEAYFYAESSTVHTSYSDGSQVYDFASGQTEVAHGGGGQKEVLAPDGSISRTG